MVEIGLLAASSIATVALAVRTYGVSKRYSFNDVPFNGGDAPTVTVCIAARNEMHALAQCLERVLKSDYQKIEILVLDDSSSDDTSLIIKSFASAGVRFIAGTALPSGWLGRNHAYQTLANEASGDLLMFLDVDTTIQVKTISRLVDAMQSPNTTMLSVLPRRTDIEHPSAFVNTLRYHWELLLGTPHNLPASSALWMIRKTALGVDGTGLINYATSVRPERHLAKQLAKTGAYRYYVSTATLGVSFEKRLRSQWETATRLYYPMASRNLGLWLFAVVFMILLLVPFAIILSWQWNQHTVNWAFILLSVNFIALSVTFKRLHGPGIWRMRAVIWPILIVQEIVLTVASYILHASGSVTWKGRSLRAQPTVHNTIQIDE